LLLAIRVIIGGPWLTFGVNPRKGHVLYLSAEGSARKMRTRVEKLCRGLRIDPNDVLSRITVIDRAIAFLPSDERARLRNEAWASFQRSIANNFNQDHRRAISESRDVLLQTAMAAKAPGSDVVNAICSAPTGTWALVVIDTVAQCCQGDENSAQDMRLFTRAMRELAGAQRCPVVALHHTAKGRDAVHGAGRSSRGSSELTAGARVTVTVDSERVAHFKVNEHAAPDPVGYALVDVERDGLCINAQRRAHKATEGRNAGVQREDVESVLKASKVALTLSKIREGIAGLNGAKPGSKASVAGTQRALDLCVQGGSVIPCVVGRGSTQYRYFDLQSLSEQS